MPNEEIVYTTPEQQLEKLKAQKLIIDDERFALDSLKVFGYSNLIKSYREPYTYIKDTKKQYRSDVTFEQIYSLFILDKNLRNAVMASMLDLEEHIKEIAAEVVASSFGIHQNEYLSYKNYRDRKTGNKKFTLKNILKTMRETLNTTKEPIFHYNNKYGLVPPWILFKSIYLSTIINYIKMFKRSEQEEMVSLLYDFDSLNLSMQQCRMLMMDTLFISYEYRNIAAHGGRIYNYSCNAKLRSTEIFGTSPEINPFSGFSQLLFLLSLLKYQSPYDRLETTLTDEINRHCKMYPQDVTYLGQILNIDITKQTIVFLSPKKNIYHSNEHCSGMQNALSIRMEKAMKMGFIPCKKCCSFNSNEL